MLWSAPGMIVGLTLAAVAFHCARSRSHCTWIRAHVDGPFFVPSYDRTHGRRARHGRTLLTSLVCDRVAVNDHLRRVVCERIGERALATG